MKLETIVFAFLAIATLTEWLPLPPFARLLCGVGALALGLAALITALRDRHERAEN
ncbi:hypothetical protein ACTXI4_17750 [Glutamicibacter ardleyensis]|uniref:hypothetical protein n=1 Tax=Glutamicibacter ardleyensis TaxID=225894 RepID=UPI003FD5A241